ncbi:NUDIX domain-containing protein [Streptomyces sp. VRA16 Mangrove soil]|nr:NUDIX domain-containing protein [Streptomyces sp. VRA16 Mangrove soil]
MVDVLAVLQRPDGRVLLVRRSPRQAYAPNLLTVPGGHLEHGESVAAGTLREVLEEVGLSVGESDLEFSGLIHYRGTSDARIGVVFAARRWRGEPYNAEPDKHTGLVWAAPTRPPADCHPYTAAALAAFCAGALYTPVNWGPAGPEVTA